MKFQRILVKITTDTYIDTHKKQGHQHTDDQAARRSDTFCRIAESGISTKLYDCSWHHCAASYVFVIKSAALALLTAFANLQLQMAII